MVRLMSAPESILSRRCREDREDRPFKAPPDSTPRAGGVADPPIPANRALRPARLEVFQNLPKDRRVLDAGNHPPLTAAVLTAGEIQFEDSLSQLSHLLLHGLWGTQA